MTAGDTTPTFSPEDGLLRLPPAALGALAAWGERPETPKLRADSPETIHLLSKLGVAGPHGLHPLLEPMATTLARPLVRLRLRVGTPAPPLEVSGWIVPGWAVFSLPVSGKADLRDIVAVHPTRLPGMIATVVSLGPRPGLCLPGPVILPTAAARALIFEQGGLDSRSVLSAAGVEEPWHEALERLAALRIRTWSARSTWPLGNEVASRRVRVIDGGEAGLWLWTDATIEGRPVTQLTAVVPAVVWGHVTALLPDADDFASVEARAPGAAALEPSGSPLGSTSTWA
ncbi:MAG: hypothetical protein ABR592_06000 [Nitriliruptorales bacterium]